MSILITLSAFYVLAGLVIATLVFVTDPHTRTGSKVLSLFFNTLLWPFVILILIAGMRGWVK